MRGELDLPLDHVQYRSVIDNAMRKQEELVKEVVGAAQALLDLRPPAAAAE